MVRLNLKNLVIKQSVHLQKKNSLCYVKIYIDFNQTEDNVIIEFSHDTNHTADYLSIETCFSLAKMNDSIINYVNHVCSSVDLCDQMFI